MKSSPSLRGTFGAAFVATSFASWGAISLSVGALGQGVIAGLAAMCFALIQILNARSLWLSFQRVPKVALIIYVFALIILPLLSGVVTRYFLIRAEVGSSVAQAVFEEALHPLFSALAGMAAEAAFVFNGIVTAAIGSFLILLMVGVVWAFMSMRAKKHSSNKGAEG